MGRGESENLLLGRRSATTSERVLEDALAFLKESPQKFHPLITVQEREKNNLADEIKLVQMGVMLLDDQIFYKARTVKSLMGEEFIDQYPSYTRVRKHLREKTGVESPASLDVFLSLVGRSADINVDDPALEACARGEIEHPAMFKERLNRSPKEWEQLLGREEALHCVWLFVSGEREDLEDVATQAATQNLIRARCDTLQRAAQAALQRDMPWDKFSLRLSENMKTWMNVLLERETTPDSALADLNRYAEKFLREVLDGILLDEIKLDARERKGLFSSSATHPEAEVMAKEVCRLSELPDDKLEEWEYLLQYYLGVWVERNWSEEEWEPPYQVISTSFQTTD